VSRDDWRSALSPIGISALSNLCPSELQTGRDFKFEPETVSLSPDRAEFDLKPFNQAQKMPESYGYYSKCL